MAVPSRRAVLHGGALGAALMTWRSLVPSPLAAGMGTVLAADQPPARSYDFNQGWLFGGEYRPGAEQPGRLVHAGHGPAHRGAAVVE